MLKKALIAEDDPVSLHVLKTMLEKWDYAIATAADGVEALAKFQEDADIQLVISDWMMPNIDGLQLCRHVRSSRDRPYTYFILLTAKSQIEDVVEGMEAGADDFISKPFNQYELKVRIRAGERVLALHNELAAKIQALSEAGEQMSRDIEAAAAIQMSMLPSKQKKFPGVKYAWNYAPCDRVGGDFFNLVSLDENHIGIYIFDVSGHGVPAALQSVALGRMLSAYDPAASLLLKQGALPGENGIVPPREVTMRLNSRFQFAGTRGDFITFLYGILDRKECRFRYTRAGHPAPLIISGGKAVSVTDEGGIPIGIISDPRYSEQTVQVARGDRIYLFTDGLVEVANPSGERFGEERLRDYLLRASSLSLDATVSGIVQEILNWRQSEPKADDQTILGIEVDAPNC